MQRFIMQIRDKYIDKIRDGTKKREYRLNDDARKGIGPLDVITMVSNSNKREFVNVVVQNRKVYKTWNEALSEHWEDDFKGLYSDFGEALKECYRFYTKELVDRYGIVVFDIEPEIRPLKESTILLDTNIIIQREGDSNLDQTISTLYNWFDKYSCRKYVHQRSKDEVQKYKDEKYLSNFNIKLSSYTLLETSKHKKDDNFLSVIDRYKHDENSKVDNDLLFEVYSGNVDLMVTNDNGILRKAEELYISDRVMTPAALLDAYETEFPTKIDYKVLSIKLKKFKDINLKDPFFDSLREDYAEFNTWFDKKIKSNDEAYVFEDNGNVLAFLYLKIEGKDENDRQIVPQLPKVRKLKVGTFKIDSQKAGGFRLGERFLKIIFDYASKSEVDFIYVTMFEHRDEVIRLKDLMQQWGFYKHGTKNNETVLGKELKRYDEKKTPKENFPLCKLEPDYYFLPINPKYHTDLFPDNYLKNEDIKLYEGNLGHRYALEKIYVTGALQIDAKPGDFVVIYRNGERWPKRYSSVCTGLCVVEEIDYPKTIKEYLDICKNKSVFTEEELKQFYSKYKAVVKLIHLREFKYKIPLSTLQDKGLIGQNSGPRPFTKIPIQFISIFKEGKE